MAQANTIQDTMQRAGGATTGFDYLRIGLAVAVLVWHSMPLSTGQGPGHLETEWWTGPLRFLPAAILPMFFALSGFLVAGSLGRTRLHQFVTLRVVRLIPALAVEIVLSALILGPILTSLPRSEYFSSPQFHAYFLNIVGSIHYNLPGVFQDNPFPGAVNGQLWTIPFEMECYLALVLLSICTLLKRRLAYTLLVLGASVAITVRVLAGHPVDTTNHVPGRMLVLCFLAAVSVYLYRDVLPYSSRLGTTAAIAAAALLQEPNLSYLAAFPIAYLTVWLGLMRPPAIPFGDLSYGVYLFHFPIEQTVVHLCPGVRSWWLLTLIALPLTTACAWLSWNLIEKPTLVRKKRILAAVDRAWATLARLGRPALWRIGNETPTDPDAGVRVERN